ncbi:hypothetical protein L7F22_057271 [Adiantum nelumboides]|nr:hypothetical protein [Adiantum nelumboides]
MGPQKVSMEVGADKVAILTINNPPVNSLSNAVYNGLYECFKKIQERSDVKAIVITGANGKFCGGADIRKFQEKQNSEEESEKAMISPLNLFNNIIEACERPVVAAIEGFALGGGLELAMGHQCRFTDQDFIRDASVIFGTQKDSLRTWAQEMVCGIVEVIQFLGFDHQLSRYSTWFLCAYDTEGVLESVEETVHSRSWRPYMDLPLPFYKLCYG